MKNFLKIVIIVLALIFLTLFNRWQQEKNRQQKNTDRYSALVNEVAALVKSDYVEEVDPEGKFPAAFDSLFHALDPQSAYLDAHQSKIYLRILQGTAFFSGIYGQLNGYQFHITDVKKNSAAERALLRRGDKIESVNGKPFLSTSLRQAYLALVSDRPQTLMLSVKKRETENRVTTAIQLENYEPASVVKDLGEGCLLLNLGRIQARTVMELEQKIRPKQHPALIIDLTQTECGDLESLLKLTRLFFPYDPAAVALKTKRQSHPLAIGSRSPLSYKAVVIIDESTQMFGELLAALFQKNRYTLIGKPSAGLSVKVDQFSLEDGSSVLLTTGYFFLDEKNMLHNRIAPDQEIAEDQLPQVHDLAKKILSKIR